MASGLPISTTGQNPLKAVWLPLLVLLAVGSNVSAQSFNEGYEDARISQGSGTNARATSRSGQLSASAAKARKVSNKAAAGNSAVSVPGRSIAQNYPPDSGVNNAASAGYGGQSGNAYAGTTPYAGGNPYGGTSQYSTNGALGAEGAGSSGHGQIHWSRFGNHLSDVINGVEKNVPYIPAAAPFMPYSRRMGYGSYGQGYGSPYYQGGYNTGGYPVSQPYTNNNFNTNQGIRGNAAGYPTGQSTFNATQGTGRAVNPAGASNDVAEENAYNRYVKNHEGAQSIMGRSAWRESGKPN